ncbi:NAD(P)H:quinone oxidoreductase type IV [Planococcus sp. N028]|uniref:NAD(P)H:quinone oxidoreductase type IV n=1 Tax=Planococcus shixiaomingii TaxID=3058393 RepID=A0ABT8N5X2_9BACL|nr:MULTISPECIES: NAD(P)H:quinone oxidoreductase type IV [unclassified Planococcus (in: firmicutes)]MDN7243284.1 NAD(P)H:quinone oxidoreductase type IV [Planococcus sp. N028]WKA55226.1 NAD(P)H:quinone oxidoreductase type IV [Planococcus sp. N022]
MANVKLAIIYYSSTGTNYQMARWAEEAATEVGVEVRVAKVSENASPQAIAENPAWQAHMDATQDVPVAEVDLLEWADAIIFSFPTRYGHIPSQAQQFFDITGGAWAQGKLANKVVSAMSSAQNPHGGQETTVLAIYTSVFHWGAIVAAPGYREPALFKAGGNPYGTSVSVDQQNQMVEDVEDAVKLQSRHTVEVAGWVKNGQSQ